VFEGDAAEFAVALDGMTIAEIQQGARRVDGQGKGP